MQRAPSGAFFCWPKNNLTDRPGVLPDVQILETGDTIMKSSGIAKECALNSCKSINRITGLGLKLVQRADKEIDLLCEKGRQVDSWKSWENARVALWASFLVVEAACLKNVLLADSAAIERRLAAAEKNLAETAAKLKTAKTERDLCMQAAAVFARCIESGAD
jgi:hypothetical protein